MNLELITKAEHRPEPKDVKVGLSPNDINVGLEPIISQCFSSPKAFKMSVSPCFECGLVKEL